jgi:UDP-N-acetylmuramate-alanine ligase
MKHGPSIQEERDALLEHMHASRVTYRQLLTDLDTEQKTGTVSASEQLRFPRSMTMRWIMRHRYLCAVAATAAVAAIVIGPRHIARSIAGKGTTARRASMAKKGPLLGTIAAVTTVILRNPPATQLVVKMFSAASSFWRHRRKEEHS